MWRFENGWSFCRRRGGQAEDLGASKLPVQPDAEDRHRTPDVHCAAINSFSSAMG